MLQRKKEKRLEKQNAVKALSPVSVVLLTLAGTSHIILNIIIQLECNLSDPQSYSFFYFMSSLEDHEENSENHREADFIDSDGGNNTPVESAETPNPTKSAEDEERSEANEEEENSVGTAEEDDAEIKVCGDLIHF